MKSKSDWWEPFDKVMVNSMVEEMQEGTRWQFNHEFIVWKVKERYWGNYGLHILLENEEDPTKEEHIFLPKFIIKPSS